MKNRSQNIISGILAVIITLSVNLACNQYGTQLEYNGSELYYTNNVTETEAKRLGDYLVKAGFFSGRKKAVQLDKNGAVYQFRMVIKEEAQQNNETAETMRQFGRQYLTGFFKNAPFEIHLCDDQLKTLRVVKI